MIPARDLIRIMTSMQHGQVVKKIAQEKGLIDCLITMFDEYDKLRKNSPQLRKTIEVCNSKLDDIKLKIDDQLDKGAKILRVVEAFLKQTKIVINFNLDQH